jgi:antitoxin (DNA-binding transcriptional repressor) of toxin-antitoxin stability system
MEATLSELDRQPRKIVLSALQHGEEIILVDAGKPVAKIVPYMPIKVFDDPDLMRQDTLTDQAINDAIREGREDSWERLDAR